MQSNLRLCIDTIELFYAPTPDYFGTDHFTFEVSDGTWTSNEATVSIEIIGVNDGPEA